MDGSVNSNSSILDQKEEIESQAGNLLAHLQQANSFGQLVTAATDSLYTKDNCRSITENILKQADTTWGGFGKAPKFPQTFTIQYLLQYHYYTKDTAALEQALLSIDKMMEGGIYDHVGGGFARYSTDNEWLAPHFEKMLYDNALLLQVLCDAYQLTLQKKYASTIRKTIAFVLRELMDKEGGFYAALDADSEGVEGKFYVWDPKEIADVLGNDAVLFGDFFDVSANGNWEGKNILRILKQPEVFAAEKDIPVGELEEKLNNCLEKLLKVRNSRIRPITDDKILLGWNALMISALCKAAAALQDETYKIIAVQSMEFVLQKFRKEEAGQEFFHTFKQGVAKYPAFLDDYAYLIQALIQLQELTSDTRYLDEAKELTTYVLAHFSDEDTGYFYFTSKYQGDIILRKKEVYDGATPSGNSIMADNLFYLSVIFNIPEWHNRAEKITTALGNAIVRYPTSFGVWASLLLKSTFERDELVITGDNYMNLRNQLLQVYLPGKILMAAAGENKKYPMLNGKESKKETLIYWCRQYSCKSPVLSIEKLLILLKEGIKFK